MKSLLALIIIAFFSLQSSANDLLDGYIIMQSRDTIKCKFSLRSLRKFSPFYEIRVTTENGEEKSFRGRDNKILGYGFWNLGVQYHFWYIEMKQKSESGFYQQLIIGPKYKLYSHILSSSTYPGISMTHPQYVLFNPAGDFSKFEICVLCPWKKAMREVFKDDANALELLNNASNPIDVPNFIAAVNKD